MSSSSSSPPIIPMIRNSNKFAQYLENFISKPPRRRRDRRQEKKKNAGTHARHARDEVTRGRGSDGASICSFILSPVSWRPPIADELQCVCLRDACAYTPPWFLLSLSLPLSSRWFFLSLSLLLLLSIHLWPRRSANGAVCPAATPTFDLHLTRDMPRRVVIGVVSAARSRNPRRPRTCLSRSHSGSRGFNDVG